MDEVTIELLDDRTGTAFAFAVDARSALDAFHHPFAYAPADAAEPVDASDAAFAA
jgi:hypothetical protein